jgi:hypothetical protein
MSTGGWITMMLSVGFVSLLFGWCIYKVLSGGAAPEKLHSLDSIDTKDTDQS